MALLDAEVDYFPEEYLLKEEEMGGSNPQFQLVLYLVQVLEWYYRLENWLICGNLELYHPAIRNTLSKVTPDISVFKDIGIPAAERDTLTSWDITDERPCPPVVFEISSQSTWRSDVWGGSHRKPAIYSRIGVKEYFAYDPNQPQAWTGTGGRRLLGWRYTDGQTYDILPDERGWLWSEELQSWLGAAGNYLRLYDRDGNMRLKESEDKARQLQNTQTRLTELERQLRELRGESTNA